MDGTARDCSVQREATASSASIKPFRRQHVAENSLLSLISAASLGASFVEFDVQVRWRTIAVRAPERAYLRCPTATCTSQVTRDGVPVIHHDWTVLLPGPAAVRDCL